MLHGRKEIDRQQTGNNNTGNQQHRSARPVWGLHP
jgi:hypothetical protein